MIILIVGDSMKRSAGIVAYKYNNQDLYIFLAHMGGPYWEDINVWSTLKGEYDINEKAIDVAIREFQEECGFKIEKDKLFYLHTEKQKSKKLVILFAAETDINPNGCTSNSFQMEYPKGSNQFISVLEMDKFEWFPIEEAKKIILPGQRKSLIKLEKILKKDR